MPLKSIKVEYKIISAFVIISFRVFDRLKHFILKPLRNLGFEFLLQPAKFNFYYLNILKYNWFSLWFQSSLYCAAICAFKSIEVEYKNY